MILVGAGALLALVAAAGASTALPDLVVANADVDTNVRSPTQGNTVTLEAVVHNNGDQNASSFTVRFRLDASATLAFVAVSGVPAGGSVNVTASWGVGSTTAGAHTLEATADINGTVGEGSEGNNVGTHDFEVNEAPTAVATVNVTTHDTLVPFSFGGATSTDSDGTIQSYLWLFDDGTTSTLASPTHSFMDGGPGAGKVYIVTLIVTDDDGGTGSDQITLHVVNRAPSAGTNDVQGNTVTALAFDGTPSTDLDGRIVNATWAFSDGVTLYGLTVLRSFDDNGDYTCTLTIRDDDGATDSTGCSITIFNQAPTAVISTAPAMPFQMNTVANFDGRNSFDVDGGITNFTWIFPGGSTHLGSTANFTFTANGTYNVTLVLVDDDGEVGELTIAALVGNDTIGTRTPTPPVGRIATSALTVFTGEPVQLDASNSSDDTGIISYLWDYADGSSGVGVVVSHAWANDGNFVVQLNVTDTDGNTTFVSLTIHVKDRPPIAGILASPTDTQTLTPISFDGGSSSDPDGSILFYRWNFGDGTVLYGQSVQHTYARAGTYTVALTVTDNDGVDASQTISIAASNRAPKSIAPANFSVPTFEERLFDGSLSFDLDGVVQTYTWNFGDGQTGTGRQAKHAFATIGTFTVTLTVKDDLGATGASTMTVTVTNNAPSVSVTGPNAIYTSDTANFVGGAVDRDGTVAAWAWDFGDGASSAAAGSANHPYSTRGTYTVRLKVTDNNGANATAAFVIVVMNRLPSAVISAPTGSFSENSLTAVNFASVGSTDAESASSLAYFWIFGDGGVAQGPSVSHAFSKAGTFTVILTVSDPDGGASSATFPVVIRNQKPVAAIATNLTGAGLTLAEIEFTGATSTDPDGTVQSYLWDFGDNATASGRVVKHTYQVAPVGGAYTVRLKVFDNLGDNASTEAQVTVNNRAPTGMVEVGEPIYANVSAFFRGTSSTDADGIIVEYKWDFGDQTATQAGSEVGHSFATPGTYTVTLTVRDNRGGESSSTKEVIVQARPTYNLPGTNNSNPQPTPGFEGGATVIAVLGAAMAVAAASRRRRA